MNLEHDAKPESFTLSSATEQAMLLNRQHPNNNTDETAWHLAATMRLLVRDAQQKIIEPARKTITQSKKGLKSAHDLMTAALKSTNEAKEKALQEISKKMQATIEAASAEVDSCQSETGRLLNAARSHLNKQQIAINDGPPPLHSTSSSGIPNEYTETLDPSHDPFEEAAAILANMRLCVDDVILKTSKPINPIWPNGNANGCALLVLSAIAGGICAGLTQSGAFFSLELLDYTFS